MISVTCAQATRISPRLFLSYFPFLHSCSAPRGAEVRGDRYINEIPKAWVAHAGGWAGKGRAGGWRCGGAATKSGDDWGSGAEFRRGPNPYRPPSLGAPPHQQSSVETPPQPEYGFNNLDRRTVHTYSSYPRIPTVVCMQLQRDAGGSNPAWTAGATTIRSSSTESPLPTSTAANPMTVAAHASRLRLAAARSQGSP
jgi:hypothetical protein